MSATAATLTTITTKLAALNRADLDWFAQRWAGVDLIQEAIDAAKIQDFATVDALLTRFFGCAEEHDCQGGTVPCLNYAEEPGRTLREVEQLWSTGETW